MSKAALATKSHVDAAQAIIDIFVNSLLIHTRASFSTAHQVVSSDPVQYSDSNEDNIGTRELVIDIAGTRYYVPCKLLVGDVPLS